MVTMHPRPLSLNGLIIDRLELTDCFFVFPSNDLFYSDLVLF